MVGFFSGVGVGVTTAWVGVIAGMGVAAGCTAFWDNSGVFSTIGAITVNLAVLPLISML